MAGGINNYYGIDADQADQAPYTPLDPAKVAAIHAQAAANPMPSGDVTPAGTAFNPMEGNEAAASKSVSPVGAKTASNPYGVNFDVNALARHLHDQRMKDVGEGMNFGSQFFGRGNPQIAEIENAQHDRAMNGFSPGERTAYSQAANQGINQQLSTGIRAVRGAQATNGVRGGAAGGQFAPVLNQANQARANSESQLNAADYAARTAGMKDYQGTVTGEREGELGTAFGFGSMGAGDRSSALQYGLGSDDLNKANAAVTAAGTPDFGDHPWNVKDSIDQWKKHNYDPNYMPQNDWLHKNVWDKNDMGINTDAYNPLAYMNK